MGHPNIFKGLGDLSVLDVTQLDDIRNICQIGDRVEMLARIVNRDRPLLDQQTALLGEAEQRLGGRRMLARRRCGVGRAAQLPQWLWRSDRRIRP